jgi:hypothetical protein
MSKKKQHKIQITRIKRKEKRKKKKNEQTHHSSNITNNNDGFLSYHITESLYITESAINLLI